MKCKKRNIILFVCVVLIVLIATSLTFIFKKTITFSLVGEEVIVLSLEENFNDPGIDAKKCNVFKCQDISDNVEIINNIDLKKIGEYQLEYKLKIKEEEKILSRKVKVVDTIAPEIELIGKTEINTCPNKNFVDEGFKAIDNYDGDITDKVTKELIGDTIYYKVSDSSNNIAEAKRVFTYDDTEKPVLTLKGKKTLYMEAGSKYNESGYTVTDNCDGNIVDKVTVTNNINKDKAGEYEITYTATDAKGNTTTATRKVYIYDFNTKDKDEYAKSLDYYIKSNGWNISVGYINIDSNYNYKYNPDTIYYGASLIKTLDAMYVYEKMTVTTELKALVKPLIEKSNNAAHNKLVNRIGLNNLRAYGRSLGAKNVLTRSNTDYFGNTTVNDQLLYLSHLYEVVNTNKLGDELKSYFINDYTNFLKFDGGPTIMHKYGWFGDYYHNVGIALDDKPYIIVILTKEATNTMNEAVALQKPSKIVNDLSRKIYNFNKLM